MKLRRFTAPLRPESGQSAVLLAVIGIMFLIFGFAIVDVGVAFGARRDAQSDADLIALAAAIELPSFDDDAGAVANAEAAAAAWATANNVEAADISVNVIDSCFSASDGIHTGVEVTLQREPTGYFFGALPGVTKLSVSATATACSGRADRVRRVPAVRGRDRRRLLHERASRRGPRADLRRALRPRGWWQRRLVR